MEDRRQYYRINDKVSLNYKVVQTDTADDEINRARHGYAELAELRNALFCIDARMDDVCDKLKPDYPLIAELATLINKKIALHERMLGFDEYDDHILSPAREISLSANGLAFEAETPIVAGSHLKLELVTYPENYYIPLYARVVTCRKNNQGKAAGFTIAVEFEAISEKDRERIMQHILARQAVEIKKKRETDEAQSETAKTSLIK